MKLHTQFKSETIETIKEYLNKHFVTTEATPKAVADEAKKLASRVRKSTDALHLRTILIDYIALASPLWRKIAPFTNFNKLVAYLESVVNRAEYSPHAIQLSHITHLHEYYLVKQKELIEPLQIQIHTLQLSCQVLQKTVSSLRDENNRLRIENDFFTQEIMTLHAQFSDNPTTTPSREKACKEEALPLGPTPSVDETPSQPVAAP